MKNIFQENDNCWKLCRARRAAPIVDGEAYYRALHEAMRRAEYRIIIVGWDIHSELQLIRDGATGGYPSRLGDFLNTLVQEKNRLEVYLLVWDFAMIYAMEREFFPRYKLQWRTGKNIHFCLDGEHPIGGSQHQKMVVIDDAIAFAGGFDISKWRWDTSAHRVDDERRMSPSGEAYPPFHDVQMIVDAEAARAIAAVALERWEVACEKRLEPVQEPVTDPWPESIRPEFRDIEIAISRTIPGYRGYSEIREVEKLYLDSIRAALHTIYIENQYLSSDKIGKALADRLDEESGPEIVLVMPLQTGGWLEQHSMDVLRGRVMQRLHHADRWGHLRIFYPRLAKPRTGLMVHAKVMVIDDNFLRVGSSNLSNRSLGLDSECDLSLHIAEDDPAHRGRITGFRNRLLAEHLGCDPAEVETTLASRHSLIETIDELRAEGERTLVPIDPDATADVDPLLPESALLDPERPLEPEELLEYFVDRPYQKRASRRVMHLVGILAFALGLAGIWRFTPLNDWLDIQSVLNAAQWIERQPLTPLIVIMVFILGGLFIFPVTLMIIATIVIFGPWLGMLYTFTGSLLSALSVFWIGRRLGKDVVRKLSGTMVNRVNKKLSGAGIPAVITLRLVPVAPFSVINLIAGISDISMRDFAVGTIIGLLPGIIAVVVVGDQIARTLKSPDLTRFSVLLIAIVGVGLAIYGLRRHLSSRQKKKATDQHSAVKN